MLSIGCGLLALALILVVVSASAVHIERKRLLALADAMAADAATAIALPEYYAGAEAVISGGGPSVPLTDASVRAAAQEYLDRAPVVLTGRVEGLRVIAPTGTPDGATAEVTVAARARPPLVPWVLLPWSDGIDLRATSRARAE
ncbi:hypothetical protein PU560_02660 [Georgenia sp. 10Sc9-8]|uniref:Flp pilus-assembly TadG-like N-terminal domain-containing protein n=1 Tax=Georgenia halotolerans TaxID=3028317 RepID=A0ABT5TTH8_9MICO|nr:hypothetical protein [Georgenia halotolerans]